MNQKFQISYQGGLMISDFWTRCWRNCYNSCHTQKWQANDFKPLQPICLFWPKQRSSKFHSLLSPSLSTNNMGHMCKIINIDGQLFDTHSLSYFNHYQIWWLHKCNHYTKKLIQLYMYVIYLYQKIT